MWPLLTYSAILQMYWHASQVSYLDLDHSFALLTEIIDHLHNLIGHMFFCIFQGAYVLFTILQVFHRQGANFTHIGHLFHVRHLIFGFLCTETTLDGVIEGSLCHKTFSMETPSRGRMDGQTVSTTPTIDTWSSSNHTLT